MMGFSRQRLLQIEQLNSRDMLTANAELFLDINDGEESSLLNSDLWLSVGDIMYFAADDGVHGTELWTTDGTAEGTKMITDINKSEPEDPFDLADTLGSFPTDLTLFRDEVYFAATTEDGDELWKTDGTAEGTVQVRDIWEGEGNAFPLHLTVFNDTLFFLASTEEEGGELWKSDGTTEGTGIVIDLVIGEVGSNPSQLYVFDDALYFSARPEDEPGAELFKTDGTELGTELVKNIHESVNAGSFPESFFEFKDELYFIAADDTQDNGTLSSHLYKSDGTMDGTVRVADEQITLDLLSQPNVVEFNDHLYFGGIANGTWELYRAGGTPGSSELVMDLQGAFVSAPSELTVFNGELYFAANDPTGRQLWRTNGELGEANVSEQLTFVDRGVSGLFPSEFHVFNGSLFFNGHDGENTFQVWETDGNDIAPVTQFEASENTEFFSLFHEFGDALYFRGGGEDGLELWRATVAEQPALDGDVDGNGAVNFADFLILSGNFGKDVPGRENGDLDGDGSVQFADFLILSGNFGRTVDAAFATL